jgi:hypothetical protein
MTELYSEKILLGQIISGVTRCRINDNVYYISAPSAIDKLEASIIYEEIMEEGSLQGILSENEMLMLMIEKELWSNEEEREIQVLPTKIDTMKAELFSSYSTFQGNRVKQIRNLLKRSKNRYTELCGKRHANDLYTDKGLAESVYSQYLISKNTRDLDGNPVDTFNMQEWVFGLLTNEYMRQSPSENIIRRVENKKEVSLVFLLLILRNHNKA